GYIYKLYWSNLSRNINTTQAQQKAVDDALIAHANRLKFEKCSVRLQLDIKPKEATFQVVLDALALTPFYQAFPITLEELYDDVNVNLGNEDTEMTNADKGASEQQNASQQSRLEQEEEDAHVTLTPVLDTQKTRANNEIASLMDTTAHHATSFPEITSSFTTPTPSPPSFFNPLSQQATPTLTPMASKTTTSLPALPDFVSVLKFNERVSSLEKDLSKMNQVDQYAKALTSIPAIINRYIDKKLVEAINKAIQAHIFDCKEEAQAEKREYIELVDSAVRTFIKEEVNTQLPQILPQAILDVATPVIEKNVNESLEAAVLTRSLSQS
nr:hypothetical protein [Tanacetum cinerariifolium]